jgi:hypothetical protein
MKYNIKKEVKRGRRRRVTAVVKDDAGEDDGDYFYF